MTKRDWLMLFAFLCILGVAIFAVERTSDNTDSLRAGLIKSCEENGNPLREAEREDLEEGITDLRKEITSLDDPIIKQLFPNVPLPVVEDLVRESNEDKQERIDAKQARLPDVGRVSCEAIYGQS